MRFVLSWKKLTAVWSALLLALVGVVAVTVAQPSGAAVAPIAYGDAYAASLGQTVTVPAPGILGNDFGVSSGYEAKLMGDLNLGDGTLDLHSDGSLTFSPNGNGAGEANFKYCIAAGSGGDCVSNTTMVQLFNGEPYVPNHSYVTTQEATLNVPAPGLLQDAQNVGVDDYLYVTAQPDHGTLQAQNSGAYVYTPPTRYVGTASFRYCISDDEVNDHPTEKCVGYDSMRGTVSVYPAVSPQSFSVAENSSHDGSLYPAPSGALTFAGLITSAAAHGAVDLRGDGTFTYTPTVDYSGSDTFAFCITQDAQTCITGSSPATVSIAVTPLSASTSLQLAAPAVASYSAPVALAAQVTPAGASGTVAFGDNGGPISGCAAVLVVDGGADCTPPTLSPGVHSFTAAFTGTGGFLSSTAGPVTTTVTPAPTTVVYTGTATATTGSQFTASATLTRTVGGSEPLPGQSITFSVTGDSCTGATDASGSASCELTAPASGARAVSVQFEGNATDAAASVSGTVAVSQIATTTSVTAVPLSGIYGAPIALTATLTAGGTGATGTIAFTAGGVPLPGCAAVPVASGSAACTANALGVGSDEVTAAYSGDAAHAGSSGTATVAIALRPTTLTYTGAVAATVGETITLSAVLTDTTSGAPISGQSVVFGVGGLGCTGTTAADGTISCTITPSAAAQAGPIAATFDGDPHRASAAASAQLTVAPSTSSTTLSAPAASVFTTTITLIATVHLTEPGADGNGAVAFEVAGAPIDGCAAVPLTNVGDSWQAACATNALRVGSDEVTAVYSGTADHLGSSGLATVIVSGAPTALAYTGATTGTVAEPMTVSAVLSNIAGDAMPIAGQTLSFSLAGLACAALTGADGTASCALMPGDVEQAGELAIVYSGTGDYLASQGAADVSILASPTTTTLAVPAVGTFSVPVTITATVSPTNGAGTVAFSSDGVGIDGCAQAPLADIAGSWQAVCTTDALLLGDRVISAAYRGDTSYLPSTGDAPIAIQAAPTTLAYTGDVHGAVSEPLTASAVLAVDTAVSAVIPVAGQLVTFALDGLTCKATTNADGAASCTLTPTSVEQAGDLIAAFAGSAAYLPSGATAEVAIAPAQAGIRLGSSAAFAVTGAPVTLAALVAPTDGHGTVTFSVNGSTLCGDVTLVRGAEGWAASCRTTKLPIGTDTVTARYSGSASYLGASAITTVKVSAPSSAGGSALSSTGADVIRPALVGALLVLFGAALAAVTMRRRYDAR